MQTLRKQSPQMECEPEGQVPAFGHSCPTHCIKSSKDVVSLRDCV